MALALLYGDLEERNVDSIPVDVSRQQSRLGRLPGEILRRCEISEVEDHVCLAYSSTQNI